MTACHCLHGCLHPNIFTAVEALGIEEETLIVITSDHGETLHDHECWYDHHGLYDCTLTIPLIFRYPGKIPAGKRYYDYCQHKDIMPTILEIMGIEYEGNFDGRSLVPLFKGEDREENRSFILPNVPGCANMDGELPSGN